MCQQLTRHASGLQFLRLIQRKTPSSLQLHLIVDNYGTHTHPDVQAWLARHPASSCTSRPRARRG